MAPIESRCWLQNQQMKLEVGLRSLRWHAGTQDYLLSPSEYFQVLRTPYKESIVPDNGKHCSR